MGYDNQLVAIERSLKGKEHDFEELLLLAHDATHAKLFYLIQESYLKRNWKNMNIKKRLLKNLEKLIWMIREEQ